MSDYIFHLTILFCIYAVSAQGLNLVFGLGSQFNLAHVAFMSVGSYLTALLSTDFNWGLTECLLISTLLPGLFALLVGEISLRLDKNYFAMATLAFAAIVTALEVNWKSLTKGVLGIVGIPRPVIFGTELSENRDFLIFAVAWMLIWQVIAYMIFKSRFSRSLKILGLSINTAQALGRDSRLLRNMAFFLSACFAGSAGSVFAYYLNYIDPSSFLLSEMVLLLTICIVAKPGSFFGIFPATLLLVVIIPEGLRFIEMPSSVLGPLRQMLNAIILFLVVLLCRKSLFPKRREV